MIKPKIAMYWCASCGGCEESLLDAGGPLLSILENFDVVFWPFALDYKFEDLRKLADRELAAVFVNGAVATVEQLEAARLLRRKSRLVFAQGSCAHIGGVYGLANFFSREAIMKEVYIDSPATDNPEKIVPGDPVRNEKGRFDLPGFSDRLRPLNQAIEVDYFIPGCPPPPELVLEAFLALDTENLPGKGTVLAPRQALCKFCDRRETFPESLEKKKFRRIHETEWDAGVCFLAQGIVCFGPCTRGGCGSRCIDGNMPCRGCFGPLDGAKDHGAAAVSLLSSLFETAEPDVLDAIVESIPDPGGLFYRYGAASGILKPRKRN